MTNGLKKATSKRRQPATSSNKSPSIYFLSLEVDKVLCFKECQTLNLCDQDGKPARWTVILGSNGVGKTTLLRCLAAIEVQEENYIKDEYSLTISGLPSDHFYIWPQIDSLVKSSAQITTRMACGFTFSSPGITQANGGKNTSKFQEAAITPVFKSRSERSLECSPSNSWSNLVGLIQYGYGATRRMGETTLNEDFVSKNSESLFVETASLINAEEWLLQTDYAYRSASGKTQSKLKKQFNQIVEVLKRILPDVEDVQIAPADEERSRPVAEFKTPYGWVQLSSLGLGYRTMIAWMVDLAVRLFRRYPDSDDPLAEPAIVLVDEIDLHLHPKWQRTIMSFLTERFPNTQFIVTAHSPLVVQAAKDANIVLLRREGDRVIIDNDPEIIDNWRVDQVLTSVFELPTARPASIDPLLIRRQQLLSKAKLTKKDKAELRELESQIGSLPTAETPDDIKAMDIIRRAAQLLENA